MLDSFLDSIWFDFFDGPKFGIGRRGRKLLKKGEPSTATVVGIKVARTSSGSGDDGATPINSHHYAYALDVRTGMSVQRMGCRQYLLSKRELARVGAEVAVRHRKGRVIIDWPETFRRHGLDPESAGDCADFYKRLRGRRIPEPGVDDHSEGSARRRIAKGQAAKATVLRITDLRSELFGMALENVDVDVQVTLPSGSAHQALIRKLIPPDYARHLLEVGTVLPVGVDRGGERVTIDWVAAANGQVERDSAPPEAMRDLSAPLPKDAGEKLGGAIMGMFDKAMQTSTAMAAGAVPTDAAPGHEITFEQFVEVSARIAHGAVAPKDYDAFAEQYGVPRGTWGPASGAWQRRMMSDWQLGARYGNEYQAFFKQLG